jgi:hypothetical protein
MSGLNLPKLFQNSQYLAQVGHFLGGAWIIGLPVIFMGFAAWPVSWAILVGLTAVKEFWYDTYYSKGEHDSLSDSIMDFSFYQLGAAASVLVLWGAHHLHRIG